MKFAEKKAKTVDEAVRQALEELNASQDEVDIEIIEETKGFLGLLGSKEVKVRVTLKESEEVSLAKEFIGNVASRLGIEIEVEASFNEEEKLLKIELKGDDLGILIGRRGETLDSIQYLTNIFINKRSDEYIKVTIDAENYRERRAEALVSLAKRTAAKAVKYRKNMVIEPKNPYERRIIHEALQDYPEVTTYSVGEDPNRKVIVAYKGMAGGYRKNEE